MNFTPYFPMKMGRRWRFLAIGSAALTRPLPRNYTGLTKRLQMAPRYSRALEGHPKPDIPCWIAQSFSGDREGTLWAATDLALGPSWLA